MATPYKNNGVDFDDIFEPIGSATKRADVGYQIDGEDISNRYYPLSEGGSSVTGIKYSNLGTSLGDLFAGKGSVSYWDVDLSDLNVSYVHNNSSDPQDWSLVEIVFFSNGDIRYRDNRGSSGLIIGNWYGSNGDSTNTEWRVEVLSVNDDISAVSENGIENSPQSYTSAGTLDMGLSVYTAEGGIIDGDSTSGDRIDVTFRLYFREQGNPNSEITQDINLRALYNKGPL